MPRLQSALIKLKHIPPSPYTNIVWIFCYRNQVRTSGGSGERAGHSQFIRSGSGHDSHVQMRRGVRNVRQHADIVFALGTMGGGVALLR